MSQSQPPTTHSGAPKPRSGGFSTTMWSVVVDAGGSMSDARAAAALERLCAQYWSPIFMFIRRLGSDRHEAEDLTQAFFAHLLEKDAFKRADQQKGRFRSFLLVALKRFLAHEWSKRETLKRGGQQRIISLEAALDTGELEQEPAAELTPEAHFDRRWALSLVTRVLARLRQEYQTAGKARLLMRLENVMTGEVPPGFFARCGSELGMSEEAVYTALHRLRRRFGQLLRSEVAHTVTRPAEIDDEIRYLFTQLSES